jgi:hypothetical protein
MPQTGILFAAICLGFVVYVTTKGELPAYLKVFFGATSGNTTQTSAAQNTSATVSSPSAPTAPTYNASLAPLSDLTPLTSLASSNTGTDSFGSEGVVSV